VCCERVRGRLRSGSECRATGAVAVVGSGDRLLGRGRGRLRLLRLFAGGGAAYLYVWVSLGVFPVTAGRSVGDSKPRKEQLARLRELGEELEEGFGYPATEEEADEEIARMEGRERREESTDWVQSRAARREVARGSRDAASVRGSEIADYGSRCHWRYSQK
jgi:hypothetical protein